MYCPNVLVIHQNQEYNFYQQQWLEERIFRNRYTIKFIVNKLNLQYNEALMVLTAGYVDPDIDKFIKFISEKNITKIYFFVEDTLRLYTKYQEYTGDNQTMYTDPFNTRAYEFDIISEIIKISKIDYKIYHCEANAKLFENIYKFKIHYFDWFCVDQSRADLAEIYRLIVPLEERNTWYYFTSQFKYKICNLNLRPTMPRLYIASLLCQESDTFVTWHQPIKDYTIQHILFDYNLFNNTLKNKIINGMKELEHRRSFKENETARSRIDDEIQGIDQYKTISEIRNSFIQIVSESKYFSPMPNFSEKTLKSIMSWRPFILLAPPKTLKLIKDLGFKTFDKWWDESYDDEIDHYKRFEKVYKLSQWILKQDKDKLTHMLEEMKEIVNYNKVKLHFLGESIWKYQSMLELNSN